MQQAWLCRTFTSCQSDADVSQSSKKDPNELRVDGAYVAGVTVRSVCMCVCVLYVVCCGPIFDAGKNYRHIYDWTTA